MIDFIIFILVTVFALYLVGIFACGKETNSEVERRKFKNKCREIK